MKTIQTAQSATITPGLVILVIFNATVLLAGQSIQFAPAIALSAVLLLVWLGDPRLNRHFTSMLLWAAFLSLCFIQLFNPGQVFAAPAGARYVLPEHAWLPFSLVGWGTMLTLAGWSAAAALDAAQGAAQVRFARDQIERCVLILAAGLAVLGIIQRICHAHSFFGIIPYHQKFFSIFGYVNNAASWFMLAAALALHRSWRNLPLFALFALCAWLCECRAMMPVFGLLILVKALGIRSYWLIIPGLAGAAWMYADQVLADRWFELEAEARLLWRYPYFGVGAFSHFLMVPDVSPPFVRALLCRQPVTHCDPFVFAAEYGLVGVGLLFAIAIRAIRRVNLGTCAGFGLLALALHSLIDMPLRSPAILVLALVLTAAGKEGSGSESVNQ